MLVITHKKMSDAYFIYIISGFPEHQLSSWYGIFLELKFSNFKKVCFTLQKLSKIHIKKMFNKINYNLPRLGIFFGIFSPERSEPRRERLRILMPSIVELTFFY